MQGRHVLLPDGAHVHQKCLQRLDSVSLLVPDLLRLGRICSPEACGLPGESAVRDFNVLWELREDFLPTVLKTVLWKENTNSNNDDGAIYRVLTMCQFWARRLGGIYCW